MPYFIGIELPELITLEFLRIQQLMTEERLFTGTIVKPDNLHITLLFLGSLDENELAKILDILSTVSHPPFFAELERLEVPQWHPPRLVWVSLSGDGLANLYSSLLTLLLSTPTIEPSPAIAPLHASRIQRTRLHSKSLLNL